jgi:small subunit ribosomal protein S1
MFGLTKDKKTKMDELLETVGNPPVEGDLVEGTVVAIDKASIYIDIPPFGTGIIFGREYIIARDMIRKVHVGDAITAKVVDTLNPDGYIELSLKEAKQALIWEEVEAAIKNKTQLELVVQDANKGGLLMNWQGLQGFLPASQLNSDHYPRVTDGDKMKILEELRRLVGEKLVVSVIGATPDDGKLVFSEKGITGGADTTDAQKAEQSEAYNVGDVLDGEVTGIVEFGVFVKLTNGLEGLVHISELNWSLVEDPKEHVSVGEKVKVKVIEVKDGKVSLSIKALTENPWVEAGKKYSKGDQVKGVVIKYNRHGALASIEEGVAGLIHVSDFESADDLKSKLELGKVYDFRITLFDAKDQKMTLSTKLEEGK